MNLISRNAIGMRTTVANVIQTLMKSIMMNTPIRVITAVVSCMNDCVIPF